eukprot:XP_012825952.1 PREDICTED: N-myc-interactor isoform X1 [Xenopus tropicalis]
MDTSMEMSRNPLGEDLNNSKQSEKVDSVLEDMDVEDHTKEGNSEEKFNRSLNASMESRGGLQSECDHWKFNRSLNASMESRGGLQSECDHWKFNRSLNTSMESHGGLQSEYDHWKEKHDAADNRRSNLIMEKVDASDAKMKTQRQVEELARKLDGTDEEKKEKENLYEREIKGLKTENSDLQKQIQELTKAFKKQQHVLEDIKEDLQAENTLPQKNINFKVEEAPKDGESSPDISYKCFVTINGIAILESGQTLLTFEDIEVANRVIKKGKYKLDFENKPVEVTAKPVTLNRTTQFEINMNMSKKRLCVRDLPPDLSDEYLKDKLELIFYKPSIGGGEIERVQIDGSRNLAFIDFLQSGVVERLVKQKHFEFVAHNTRHQITVEPFIDRELNKLQMFTGFSPKSVLLEGIQGVEETEDDIQDIVQIFFQKPTNGGGEVEHILHSHNRKRAAEFETDLKEDANSAGL